MGMIIFRQWLTAYHSHCATAIYFWSKLCWG